jgi:hypothetical protein
MPIVELLKRQSGNSQSFGPDDIKIIVTAFEDTLRALRLVDRKDPATAVVAKRIIALAQQGERDPIRLRLRVLCKGSVRPAGNVGPSPGGLSALRGSAGETASTPAKGPDRRAPLSG